MKLKPAGDPTEITLMLFNEGIAAAGDLQSTISTLRAENERMATERANALKVHCVINSPVRDSILPFLVSILFPTVDCKVNGKLESPCVVYCQHTMSKAIHNEFITYCFVLEIGKMCNCKRTARKRSLCKGIFWSLVNSFEKGRKKRQIQGSHSDWKAWKNGKAFSNQGKVQEF